MNLLLYAEARKILTRPASVPVVSGSEAQWIGEQVTLLPDDLFEELGYYAALADDESDLDPDNDLEDLNRWFAESVLSLQNW